MPAPGKPEVQDPMAWHRVTDEYAVALHALRRGEPAARARVLDLYAQLRRIVKPVTVTTDEG